MKVANPLFPTDEPLTINRYLYHKLILLIHPDQLIMKDLQLHILKILFMMIKCIAQGANYEN